jgi:hypothetical protein
VYDILFACGGFLLFALSLFDDRVIGIVLNVMAFILFFSSAFHIASYTSYPHYAYVLFGIGLISLVIALLRSVSVIRKSMSW